MGLVAGVSAGQPRGAAERLGRSISFSHTSHFVFHPLGSLPVPRSVLPLDVASCSVKLEISPHQSRWSPFFTHSRVQDSAIYHHFISFHHTVPGTEFSRMGLGWGPLPLPSYLQQGNCTPTTVIPGQILAGLIRGDSTGTHKLLPYFCPYPPKRGGLLAAG